MSRNHVLDGLRCLLHISMIALHCSMMATAHLPGEGPVWKAISGSWFYTASQAGGIQVDGFLMVSGYLVIRKYLDETSKPKLPHVEILNRYARFWPTLGVVLIVTQVILGDCSLTATFTTIVCNMLLISNYAFDSISLSVATVWSTCVDVQFSMILHFIMDLVKRSCKPSSLLTVTTVIMSILLAISLAVRYYNFNPEYGNLVRLGLLNHYARTQSGGIVYELGLAEQYKNREASTTYDWYVNQYNHTWLVPKHEMEDEWISINLYARRMYMPMHTRFGPMVTGALLACFEKYLINGLEIALTMKWGLLMWAVTQLMIPCAPQDPEATKSLTMQAQIFITVALRTLASVAIAIITCCGIAPEKSSMHSKWIALFFENPLFRWLSPLTFASYLVHFRVIQELTFFYFKPRFVFDPSSPNDALRMVDEFREYVTKLFAITCCFSFSIAILLHHFVEKPGDAMRTYLLRAIGEESSKKSE